MISITTKNPIAQGSVRLRSIFFSLYFYIWYAISMIIALPFAVSYPLIYKLSRYWTYSIIWGLKHIVRIDHKIIGLENLPLDSGKGFVIAAKHQSAWETLIMYTILPKAVFVYKKELGRIPIYGWYCKILRNIMVDRNAGAMALKQVLAQAKEKVGQGHQLIIFPQGRRLLPGVQAPYKPAIYAMYAEGLPVYPAALNSGFFWPKYGIRKPGTIVLKFLPPIEPGLSKAEFMTRLSSTIELESDALNVAEIVTSEN